MYFASNPPEPVGTLIEPPYPAQYSDAHITQNAVIAEERFKKMGAFSKQNLLASVIGAPPSENLSSPASEPERGTWVWTPLLLISAQDRASLIKNAQKHNIRNIYLSLDSYLDIYVLPDGPEKERQEKAFADALEAFVAEAAEDGITVDTEGGWRNWSEPDHAYKPLALLEFAKQFNQTRTHKLRGFQYDIEPYLLDDYVKRKSAVLTDFLDLVDETVSRLDGSDLSFTVVIPDFYDGAGGATPEFFYGFSYGTALDHLLTILSRRAGSSLIIMSYRNRADGADGSIAISRDEIKRANRFPVKVIIAQETSKFAPGPLTFFRMDRSYFNQEVGKIEKTFADDSSYGGIALHYLHALMELR